ncbi:hypothetical protein [Sphingomonas mesophila]|uniref:hypothetical protein n=1 Tax=Sphingomonas mesophila TaxID=2303576 RepID=UPI0013C2F2EE|nr:hypothetical protein [Sphingomonas mesophila]
MRLLLSMLSALGLCLPATGHAGGRKVPAGQWAIEYQEDDCTLSRDGVGAELGIAIRTRPLAEPHDLMIYGQFDRGRKDGFQGTLDLDGQVQAGQRWVLIEPSRGRKRTLLRTTLSAAELARLGSARAVGISGPKGFRVNAAAPGVASRLKALRECEVYLAGRWGITKAEMDGWAQPARALTDLGQLFRDKDMTKFGYLRDAMRGVLTIDAAGRMTDCKIVAASRVSRVNARFCPTLRERARFEPARNAAGEAVPGKVITPRITSARIP